MVPLSTTPARRVKLVRLNLLLFQPPPSKPEGGKSTEPAAEGVLKYLYTTSMSLPKEPTEIHRAVSDTNPYILVLTKT